MNEEKKDEVKITVPVLPCGHEASFEHEFVNGFLDALNQCMAAGIAIEEPLMEYVRYVMSYFYMQIPSYEEMVRIALANKQFDKSKEVN
jgi:hypothetical protein